MQQRSHVLHPCAGVARACGLLDVSHMASPRDDIT